MKNKNSNKSKKTVNNSNWIPEILYEENSQIPFIQVPDGVSDPERIFIFLTRESGEFEPDSEGNELPIVDMVLRQFVDMEILKNRLTTEEYDRVRDVLGLESLKSAVEKGRKITLGVEKSVNNFSQKVDDLKKDQQ